MQLPELFPGFQTCRIDLDGSEFFVRTGGSGPPLLLLHGYPQTHACWHRVAAELATRFTMVIPDLRGYGQSSALPGDEGHCLYSKRQMALDNVNVMGALGFDHFFVAGHDRGGRVAYRMALDFPTKVLKLIVLDIVPTSSAWDAMDAGGANGKFHWTYLAQPHPLPEKMIAANPSIWHEHLLANWSAAGDLSCFDERALQHYRESFSSTASIHAMCEDYRAGFSVDYQLDRQDQESGRLIACQVLALWGGERSLGTVSSTLRVWQAWCSDVSGQAIDSGHFLPEENPLDTAAAMSAFLCD